MRSGSDILILSAGPVFTLALEAADQLSAAGIQVTVASVNRLHPLDTEPLSALLESHRAVVTVEDNALAGGFGSAVMELMGDRGLDRPIERLGLPDAFVGHGSLKLLRRDVGLTAESIAGAVTRLNGLVDTAGC